MSVPLIDKYGKPLPEGIDPENWPAYTKTGHSLRKPRHAEEFLIRKTAKDVGIGDMERYDPKDLKEYVDDVRSQEKQFEINLLSLASVRLDHSTTIEERKRLWRINPSLKEGYMKAIESARDIQAKLWTMLKKRFVTTADDLNFLYGLLDPHVVIPVGPMYDPHGHILPAKTYNAEYFFGTYVSDQQKTVVTDKLIRSTFSNKFANLMARKKGGFPYRGGIVIKMAIMKLLLPKTATGKLMIAPNEDPDTYIYKHWLDNERSVYKKKTGVYTGSDVLSGLLQRGPYDYPEGRSFKEWGLLGF